MDESIALFGQTTEVAKVRYELENGELAKLTDAQKQVLLDKAAIQDALVEDKKLLDERNKALQDQLDLEAEARDSVAGLLEDMQFELDLMGKTNAERIAANELRRIGLGLSDEEREKAKLDIEAKAQLLEQNHKLIDAMDEFRAGFEDNVADVLTGAKSIGDAFKSMADLVVQQIARIIAQQLTASLFGQPGQLGGGSQGGLLSSLFGAFIPGFAEGTSFAPGGLAVVGERGPELVHLPRGSEVTPNHKLGGNNITINIQGNATRETAQYAANKVAQKLAFSRRG